MLWCIYIACHFNSKPYYRLIISACLQSLYCELRFSEICQTKLQSIAENLESEINAFAQTNRRLHNLLNASPSSQRTTDWKFSAIMGCGTWARGDASKVAR